MPATSMHHLSIQGRCFPMPANHYFMDLFLRPLPFPPRPPPPLAPPPLPPIPSCPIPPSIEASPTAPMPIRRWLWLLRCQSHMHKHNDITAQRQRQFECFPVPANYVNVTNASQFQQLHCTPMLQLECVPIP